MTNPDVYVSPEPRVLPAGSGAAVPALPWRLVVAGPAIAAVSVLCALVATRDAGVPFRDPDHVAGRRLALALVLVLGLMALDVAVRAMARRGGGLLPTRALLVRVWQERWTSGRALATLGTLVSFYLTYLAYRNLKSVVPLVRPGDLFDAQLERFDRGLLAGLDPAELLHTVLGTGVASEAMSVAYMLFFAFIPVTLALALVFSGDLQAGIFYATAQSLNWLIGAGSYFLLPSLGPVYAEPHLFSGLAGSPAGDLQRILLDQRTTFLHDPAAGGAQSIAAFASLHVSVYFTAVLVVSLLGLARWMRLASWVLLGLTVLATLYLGWHYVADDLGGVVVAVLAVLGARLLTGYELGVVRRRRPARA